MRLTVDGKSIEIDADPEMPLLWALRDVAGILGPKFGCGIGACGACTVVVDGAAVRSCALPVGQVEGAVTTIEGLARPDGSWHPVQEAMREGYALQCGFCTPGIAITLASLLEKGRQDKASMMAALSGHICRCTGYQGIRRAIDILASDTQTETAS